MFTQTLNKRVLGSALLDLLTGPHGVDRYTELVAPTWTLEDARARIVAVDRRTPRSVTLTLEPNRACSGLWGGFRAGQHINLTVEIDGRRRTRCYSPANAEGARLIELTVGLHDGGQVSSYLRTHAKPGLVVGLAGVGGDFVLPARRPADLPGRILFVSGGSGITPVMSMTAAPSCRGSISAAAPATWKAAIRANAPDCRRAGPSWWCHRWACSTSSRAPRRCV